MNTSRNNDTYTCPNPKYSSFINLVRGINSFAFLPLYNRRSLPISISYGILKTDKTTVPYECFSFFSFRRPIIVSKQSNSLVCYDTYPSLLNKGLILIQERTKKNKESARANIPTIAFFFLPLPSAAKKIMRID